jgi:hypothetical protein
MAHNQALLTAFAALDRTLTRDFVPPRWLEAFQYVADRRTTVRPDLRR